MEAVRIEKSVSLEEALQITLRCAEQAGYAEETRKGLRNNCTNFMNWCSGRGINQVGNVTTALIKTYFLDMKERQLTGYTVKIRRNALVNLFNCLDTKGVISDNPMKQLHIRPRLVEKAWPVLSLEEMGSLLAGAEKQYQSASLPRQKNIALRDKLIIEILLATGMRACEVAALKVKDVDLEKGIVHIRGKGSNWYIKRNRTGLIDEKELLLDLAAYLKARPAEGPLFPSEKGGHLISSSITMAVKRIAKHSGLNRRVTSHLLRHSFCSFLINQGADAFTVQRLMGHWQVETTLRFYLHLTPEEVKDNWQKHNPLAGGERSCG